MWLKTELNWAWWYNPVTQYFKNQGRRRHQPRKFWASQSCKVRLREQNARNIRKHFLSDAYTSQDKERTLSHSQAGLRPNCFMSIQSELCIFMKRSWKLREVFIWDVSKLIFFKKKKQTSLVLNCHVLVYFYKWAYSVYWILYIENDFGWQLNGLQWSRQLSTVQHCHIPVLTVK